MGHGWIGGVLADLRTYAQLNDLPRLAALLAEAAEVAAEEAAPVEGPPPRAIGLAPVPGGRGTVTPLGARGDGAGPRTHPRAAGGGALAR